MGSTAIWIPREHFRSDFGQPMCLIGLRRTLGLRARPEMSGAMAKRHVPYYLGGLVLALVLGNAPAAQTIPSPLLGQSIQAEYVKLFESRRAGQIRQAWSDQVYISTKGRIFHRHKRGSTQPEGSRSFEAVGDDDGGGDGRNVPYRWTGSGLSREWVNRRGVHSDLWHYTKRGSGQGCPPHAQLGSRADRGCS
jgi:hypothetical protein